MRVGILCDGKNGSVNLVSVMDRSVLVSVAEQGIKEAEARALGERDGRLSRVRQLAMIVEHRIEQRLFGAGWHPQRRATTWKR